MEGILFTLFDILIIDQFSILVNNPEIKSKQMLKPKRAGRPRSRAGTTFLANE